MTENNFFKLKVKYLIQDPDKGSIKKKTSEYVLKAVSFTDAEKSLLECLKDDFEYNLVSCSKFNIQDVRIDETKEGYFKAKISGSVMDYEIENIQKTKIEKVFYEVNK